MTSVSPPARHTGLARKLLLACGATIVAVLAAEAAYRVVLHVQGHAYSAQAARQEMDNLVGSLLARVPAVGAASPPATDGDAQTETEGAFTNDVHPYFGFEPPEFLDSVAREVTYFNSPDAKSNYDILVLGGSVAVQFGQLGAQRLVELVQADPRLAGRKVVCFGEGRSAFKQPQQVIVLSFLLCLGYRPDCVIELDGFNEVALANGNVRTDTHPLYPGAGNWAPLVRGTHLDRAVLDLFLDVRDRESRVQAIAKTWNRWGLFASSIAGRFGLNRAHRLRSESVELQDAIVEGIKESDKRRVLLGPDFDHATVIAQAVRAWSEGSLSLDALCRARGILYIHALQPTLHDKGSKPLTAAEVRTSVTPPRWRDGVWRGYPRLRAEGAELTRLGVNYIDCSMVFEHSTADFYFDGCHFNESGHVLLAEAIAPFLLQRLDSARGFTPIADAPAAGTEPRSR